MVVALVESEREVSDRHRLSTSDPPIAWLAEKKLLSKKFVKIARLFPFFPQKAITIAQ
jgi:hypothetical protein